MSNLLLITGAGASYDVVDPNLIPVNLDKRPPITKNLFYPDERDIVVRGKLVRNEYLYVNECLKEHRIAAKIGLDYKVQVHQNKEKGLEDYLTSIKNNKKILTKNQFWSIPLYLHSLFWEISRHYIACSTQQPVSTNYKLLIERINNSNYKQILWLNLNYDLFADFAILTSVNKNFDNLANYLKLETPDGLKIMYTKPHGSIDWYKQFDYSGLTYDMNDDIIKNEPTMLPENFEDRLSKELFTAREKAEIHRKDNHAVIFPAITAPIGKYDFVCAQHKIEIAKELKSTSSVLCIGFSALDTDVLDLIRNNIAQIDKLKIVNGKNNPTGNEAYSRLKEHCKEKFNVAKEDSIFNGGFSDFMKEGIQRWLGS